jgi:hypothetical protein
MKKLSLFAIAVTAATLAAGTDLPVDGKFRQISNGLPRQWEITPAGTAKITSGEDWFSRALQLTAADTAASAVSKRAFPVLISDKIEVEAEIKGSGTAFLAVALLDANDKTISIQRIATATATPRFRDIKGSLRLAGIRTERTIAKVRIIIGAEPGSRVIFDGVDAEIDRD